MLKKIMPLLVLSLVFAVACSPGGKYGDIKSLYSEITSLTNSCSEKLTDAKSGKDVASALEEFQNNMQSIMVKGDALEKKYPELAKKEDIPELAESQKEMEDASKKLSMAMMTVMQKYMGDKDVMGVLAKMSKMGKIK